MYIYVIRVRVNKDETARWLMFISIRKYRKGLNNVHPVIARYIGFRGN